MKPTPEIISFEQALSSGIPDGLLYLNRRTPHRFTGIYRFDGEVLRNVHLIDRFDSAVRRGDDTPVVTTFCAMVGAQGSSLEITDATAEQRFPVLPVTPVVSYCGALIRDDAGRPWGTLCHFDFRPCESRVSDIPLLEAAASLLYSALAGTADE